MAKRRLSIHAATTIVVIVIGSLFVLFSWSAGAYFRETALQSQTKSLARIIEVASNQVLQDIQQYGLTLHSVLSSGDALTTSFEGFLRQGESAALLASLDDPLLNGYPGMSEIELVQLRVYDLDLNFLLDSRAGVSGLPPRLPEFILANAIKREGVERLKALGGLWVSTRGPLYSMLLPIGGLHIQGYLEVVLDPTLTLSRVGKISGMPIHVSRAGGLAMVPETGMPQHEKLPIEYLLIGDDGLPAYRLIGMEDVHQLYQDMRNNQLTTTAAFILITFVILLLLLLVLNNGVFTPLKRILQGIERYREGELDTHIKPSGLRDLYTLGETFNTMVKQIRHDITELERHSNIDGLTGLGNRRYFEQRLQEEWSRATRKQWPISILFIDIDYFKRYNDHYGHLQGDDCLRRVAEAMHRAVKRDIDVAARYGGEEFIIMLPETNMSGAEKVARELQQTIRKMHIEHPGSNVEPFITLSIGIASHIPSFPEKAEELLHKADIALYQAKERGRNRIGKSANVGMQE